MGLLNELFHRLGAFQPCCKIRFHDFISSMKKPLDIWSSSKTKNWTIDTLNPWHPYLFQQHIILHCYTEYQHQTAYSSKERWYFFFTNKHKVQSPSLCLSVFCAEHVFNKAFQTHSACSQPVITHLIKTLHIEKSRFCLMRSFSFVSFWCLTCTSFSS